MDPFEPIRVDPDPSPPADTARERPALRAATDPSTDRPRMDVSDSAPAVAQTVLLLGAIENRTDAAMSGVAEVTGVAGHGDPIAVTPDPLDDYGDYPDSDAPAVGGDGCLGGAFALLLVLTTAAGTAVAFSR